MTNQLSKNAASIQEVLKNLNLECKVREFPSGTRTAADAAASIGCSVAQIAKSLIFRTKNTNRPVLVLASGLNQVNERKIKEYVGEKISRADADFVREVTGFAIGGIPPVGHKNMIDLVFIDQDLISLDELWAAAGTPNSVFCIKSSDLVNATKGKIVDIVGLK